MEQAPLTIDDFIKSLEEMDEALARNDINAVTKKVHECIARIKAATDDVKIENV